MLPVEISARLANFRSTVFDSTWREAIAGAGVTVTIASPEAIALGASGRGSLAAASDVSNRIAMTDRRIDFMSFSFFNCVGCAAPAGCFPSVTGLVQPLMNRDYVGTCTAANCENVMVVMPESNHLRRLCPTR